VAGVTLWLDAERWRGHLRTVAAATPDIVPVAKGNGYGFGLARLAAQSAALGLDTLAVGTAAEVPTVRDIFGGDLVILQPFDADDEQALGSAQDPRVITTVSRTVDLARIAGLPGRPRVLLEVLTSMRRHGIPPDRLALTTEFADRWRLEGWTIHLPLLDTDRYSEAERLSRAALAATPAPLWLSHLPAQEGVALGRALSGADGPPIQVRSRVGTRLWLGDPGAYRATATVLDLHSVRRGDRAGYRQRLCPADGWIVVLAGGTAHGIGLEAPSPAVSLRQRAIAVATGSLEAAGLALSPYTVAGKKRWFLEPPHMQSSLVFLPRSASPPAVGEEVPVELRLTIAAVDRIVPS
jgi:hypothetical protein